MAFTAQRQNMRPPKLLDRIRRCLDGVYGERLQGVVLFGSEARHTSSPDSDIDILVLLDSVTDTGRELRTCIAALYPLALDLDRRISPIPVSRDAYEKNDCPLFHQIHREGVAA